MKVAIALRGDQLSEKLDDRFGRSKYFCIYNMEQKTTTFIKNTFASEPDGVGKNVVELLTNQNIDMIVATEFGRKVRTLLENQKIQMVIIQDTSLTGDDVLKKIKTK